MLNIVDHGAVDLVTEEIEIPLLIISNDVNESTFIRALIRRHLIVCAIIFITVLITEGFHYVVQNRPTVEHHRNVSGR